MDGIVLPGSSETPPSYSRPPVRYTYSHNKNPRLLSGGIVAVVLIVLGFTVFWGGAGTGNRVSDEGTLVFYSYSPTPNVYRYSFADESVTPMIGSMYSPPSLQVDGIFVSAAISQAQDVLVMGVQKESLIDLILYNFKTGTQKDIQKDIQGSVSPLISTDDSMVAFLTVSHISSEESISLNPASGKVYVRSGPVSASSIEPPRPDEVAVPVSSLPSRHATLTVVSLADMHKISFPVAGVPIGFSADKRSLLVRHLIQKAGSPRFSIVDITTGSATPLSGVPENISLLAVALSPDGSELAFAKGEGVEWGRIDWSRAAFTQVATIDAPADSLTFLSTSGAGDLLLYKDEVAQWYRLYLYDVEKPKVIQKWRIVLPSEPQFMSWHVPQQ